jgi:hypothetical protein
MIARGWAIAGKYGLYVDWRRNRIEIIAQHVHDTWRRGYGEQPSKFPHGRGLDECQRKAWRECRSRGDRAVKVSIKY